MPIRNFVYPLFIVPILLACNNKTDNNSKDLEIYQAVANYIADIEMPKRDTSKIKQQHTIIFTDTLLSFKNLKREESWLFSRPRIEKLDKERFNNIVKQKLKETKTLDFVGFTLDTSFHYFNYSLDSNTSSLSYLTFSPVLYDTSGNYAVVVVKHKLGDPNSRIKGSFRSYLLIHQEDKWWIKNKRLNVSAFSRFHCAACALGK